MSSAPKPARSTHYFVVPDPLGPITGGTLFNRALLAALRAAGLSADALDVGSACALLERGEPGSYWLDSLYLEDFARLRACTRAPARLGVLLHYLPSLVRCGEAVSAVELDRAEALALENAERIVTPSEFLRAIAIRLGAAPERVLVVEPGRELACPAEPAEPAPGVRAVLVANVTPNKGIAPVLRALDAELGERSAFALELIGSSDFAPEYAAHCRQLVARSPLLAERVRWLGALSPDRVAARLLASNLLISGSIMESYGMALAEARALGRPIVALMGGNTRAHVSPEAGGELVGDYEQLARACHALGRDPGEHAARLARAWSARLAPRTWSDVARDFAVQTARYDQ